MPRYLNRVSITFDAEFTTNHQLSDVRLKELYEALQSALSGDCAEQMLDALREQVDEDEEPDYWGGFVPNPTATAYSSTPCKEETDE